MDVSHSKKDPESRLTRREHIDDQVDLYTAISADDTEKVNIAHRPHRSIPIKERFDIVYGRVHFFRTG